MSVSDRYIFAVAKVVIDRHGIEAASVAANRANQRLKLRDPEGAAVWRRIKKAIEEMQAIEPEGRTHRGASKSTMQREGAVSWGGAAPP